MTLQYGTVLRNARLDQIETTVGTAPILRIYQSTGSPPANPGTAANGTVLVEMTLPTDWLAAAAAGVKALLGTWQDLSANASGTADYFRIYNSGDTVAHIQGTVTGTGGGGDLELNNAVIAAGQQVDITAFSLTEGNP